MSWEMCEYKSQDDCHYSMNQEKVVPNDDMVQEDVSVI